MEKIENVKQKTMEKISETSKKVKLDTKNKIVDTGQKVKKKLTPSQEQKVLATRLILFTLFGMVLPIVFISWRYKIFNTVTKTSLTGMGVVIFIIIFVFLKYIMKMLTKAKPYSFTTQCITGFRKVVLPLLFLYFIINAISVNINYFQQALIIIIVCESIAVPINPMPKYEFDNNIQREDTTINKIFSKLKEVL